MARSKKKLLDAIYGCCWLTAETLTTKSQAIVSELYDQDTTLNAESLWMQLRKKDIDVSCAAVDTRLVADTVPLEGDR